MLLSDIPPESVQWLWRDRIANGKLNLIAGNPDVGKSLLTADIAAVVTKRGQWPDGSRIETPGSVVMLCGEDGLADTLRPRIDAAGGDPAKIVVIRSKTVTGSDGSQVELPVNLVGSDLARIEDVITQRGDVQLVVIDPLNVYVAGGIIDTNRDTDLRNVLTPLKDMAERTGVAVVLIAHHNKSTQQAAIHRVAGTVGLIAACRLASTVIRDPEDLTGPRRLWLPTKNNLGPYKGGLAYAIKESAAGAPILSWDEKPILKSADELMALPAHRGTIRPSPETEAVVEWLKGALAPSPRPANDLFDEAKSLGFSTMTVRRAKERLGVVCQKFGFQGAWHWGLPVHFGNGPHDAAPTLPPPNLPDDF